MATIALKDVRKAYGKVTVIPTIDLEIASGEFVVLVGPSGCGKSTLLRMIAGLEEITAGSIAVAGKVINALPPSERNIAMVFQDYALYPHMSVAENMAFGLKMRGESAAEIDRRVKDAAAILKLGALLDRRPSQLSGGQRQRVAMGRAIVRQPEAFLFDEPLSNLDAALRVEMRLEIAKLHRRMAATTVYVTHDQVEAMTLADRIVVMNAGKVEQLGPPMELYHRPQSLFVARFIGSPTMNTLDVPAGASGGDLVATLPGGARAVAAGAARSGLPAAVTFGVRPEDLVACDPADAWFSGQLAVVERLGSQTFGDLDIGGERLITIELPRTSEAAVGDAFSVSAAPEALHLFDAGTGLRLN